MDGYERGLGHLQSVIRIDLNLSVMRYRMSAVDCVPSHRRSKVRLDRRNFRNFERRHAAFADYRASRRR